MAKSKPLHVVMFTMNAWGHVRPLCSLAAKILEAKPDMYITFFTTTVPSSVDRIRKEILRNLGTQVDDYVEARIRIVALRGKTGHVFDKTLIRDSFPEAYSILVNEQPIISAGDEKVYNAIPKPNAVILDAFLLEPMRVIRAMKNNAAEIYSWTPAGVTLIAASAPKYREARGDILVEIIFDVRGEVLHLPGLPSIYDREIHPQKIVNEGFAGRAWMRMFEALYLCDGSFLFTPEEFEPVAISVIRDWLAKPIYTVGPLLPPLESRRSISRESSLVKEADKIENFMNEILNTRGQHSLLVISFGSTFWPSEPGMIWAFLDVVMELHIPFIMAYPSELAAIPDSTKQKVSEYKYGLLSKWIPQQSILAHPVAGWFVSHCGQNGTLEAISVGVPMICWPFYADQVFNAMVLTLAHNVAYELLQVRTGEHSIPNKPIHRLSDGSAPTCTLHAVKEEARIVLRDAFFGEGGKSKRENMKKLQNTVMGCWKDGGSSKICLDKFLEDMERRCIIEGAVSKL
ncbi:Plant UDP-glycosyltransferase [Abortiporus biennis]